ncbi:hypothetical protein CsSME_00031213 [Camellia sinensis var. sinensis]
MSSALLRILLVLLFFSSIPKKSGKLSWLLCVVRWAV